MFNYNNGPIITNYSPISSKGGKKSKIKKYNFKTRNNKIKKTKTKKNRTKRMYN